MRVTAKPTKGRSSANMTVTWDAPCDIIVIPLVSDGSSVSHDSVTAPACHMTNFQHGTGVKSMCVCIWIITQQGPFQAIAPRVYFRVTFSRVSVRAFLAM